MDTSTHTRQRCGQLKLDRWQIARVDNIRAKCPQGPEHSKMNSRIMAVGLFELNDRDRLVVNSVLEVGRLSQTDDCVTIAIPRHMVDQIDKPVLHTTDGQTVDNVNHQRRRDCACGIHKVGDDKNFAVED
jgi:hypothetical protein